MLLNSVSKLGLFRAFDNPGSLCVYVEAVMETFEENRTSNQKTYKKSDVQEFTSEMSKKFTSLINTDKHTNL